MDEQSIKVFVRQVVLETLMHTSCTDYEARGMIRDLRQFIQSHDRLHEEYTKNTEIQRQHADDQRDRIEKKLDGFIEEASKKETRQIVALLGLLLAMLAFFIIPYFSRG